MIEVDKKERNKGIRSKIGNEWKNEEREDEEDIIENGRILVKRKERKIVKIMKRKEEREDNNERLGSMEDLGEIEMLNIEEGVERKKKEIIKRIKNGEWRRIIKRCLEKKDGGRGRKEVWKRRRINREERKIEEILIKGMKRIEEKIDEIIGCLEKIIGRRNIGEKENRIGEMRGEDWKSSNNMKRVMMVGKERKEMSEERKGEKEEIKLRKGNIKERRIGRRKRMEGERNLKWEENEGEVDGRKKRFEEGLKIKEKEDNIEEIVEKGMKRELGVIEIMIMELIENELKNGKVGKEGEGLIEGGDEKKIDIVVRYKRIDDWIKLMNRIEGEEINRILGNVKCNERNEVGVGLKIEI